MRTLIGLAAGVALAWSGGAAAAPQVLALVSTAGPVELTCAGERCAARFTTFCLQSDRTSPAGGQRYTLADAAALELVGTGADGRAVRLEAAAATIKAARSHVSVTISLPRDLLARRGLQSVAVRVGDEAALVPVPEAGDPRPQTESDLALATGSLRALGRKLVDDEGLRIAAARETMYLINRLPDGRMPAAEARTLIDGLLTPARLAALPAAARPFVTDARDYCTLVTDNDRSTTVRRCLQAEHDTMMHYLNQGYWDALQGGS